MSIKLVRGRNAKILLLNPNSSSSMTDGMRKVIDDIDLPPSTEVYTYTCHSGSPASINDGNDIEKSTEAVLSDIDSIYQYDAIVVACFSVHPLVPRLQTLTGPNCAVTGIFEASVLTAISLLEVDQRWGIVTTGKFWEEHLSRGVRKFLGAGEEDANVKFAGVESTGLNASDFHHGVDPAVVKQKMKEATKRLFNGGRVHVIVMGCAGMAGLEAIIREAVSEKEGQGFGYGILHVVDGVRAGVMQAEHMMKHKLLRSRRKV